MNEYMECPKNFDVFSDLLDKHNITVIETFEESSCANITTLGETPTIRWGRDEPGSQLANLAHEIGHHVLGHCKIPIDPWRLTRQDIQFEHDAWDFSENICRERGITFDYKYKARCLNETNERLALDK